LSIAAGLQTEISTHAKACVETSNIFAIGMPRVLFLVAVVAMMIMMTVMVPVSNCDHHLRIRRCGKRREEHQSE